MLDRRIFSGDEAYLPQSIPNLPEGWEGAFVFDPNLDATAHPSEDVLAWLITKRWALLISLDGISAALDPKAGNHGFVSRPVAEHFAQAALEHAEKKLKDPRDFSLQEMHHIGGTAIQKTFMSGDIPKGGLVGINNHA